MSTPPLDALVAQLAASQHGVVARAQLLALGLTPEMIRGRIQRGLLHRIHRGVYAVGHKRLTREGRYMAAVLACGDAAALRHRTAAAHWGIRPYGGRIEVAAPGRPRGRKGDSFVACSSSLDPDEVTTHEGIPTTTVARTLIELASTDPPPRLEKAIREAGFLRLFDLCDLQEQIGRHPNHKGITKLRAIVETAAETHARTRSELEDRFLQHLSVESLPSPQVNATIELPDRTIEADMVWPDRKLIVELDGWHGHGTRAAFESDRDRDLALAAAGWVVVRVTWRMLASGIPPQLRQLLTQ